MTLLSKSSYGKLTRDDNSILGTTDSNEWYPVYAAWESERITDKVVSYIKPSNRRAETSIITRYDDLFNSLDHYLNNKTFTFIYKGSQHFVRVLKGMIMDGDGNILMALCMNSNHIWEENVLLKDNIRLFVAVEFKTTEIYKNVFKKVENEYINRWITEEDVDVIFMKSSKIFESLYKNSYQFTFDSFEEIEDKLNGDIGSVLFYEPDDNNDLFGLNFGPVKFNLEFGTEGEVADRDITGFFRGDLSNQQFSDMTAMPDEVQSTEDVDEVAPFLTSGITTVWDVEAPIENSPWHQRQHDLAIERSRQADEASITPIDDYVGLSEESLRNALEQITNESHTQPFHSSLEQSNAFRDAMLNHVRYEMSESVQEDLSDQIEHDLD